LISVGVNSVVGKQLGNIFDSEIIESLDHAIEIRKIGRNYNCSWWDC